MLATLTRWWSRFDRLIEVILFFKGAAVFLYKGSVHLGLASLFLAPSPVASMPVENPNCLENAVEGVLGLCGTVENIGSEWLVEGMEGAWESVGEPPAVSNPGRVDVWGPPVVISNYYSWPYGWDGTVDEEGHEPPRLLDELRDHLRTEGIQAEIHRSTDVVAVGVASCEGRGREEVDRAGERARSLARLVDEAYSGSIRIWSLNLGQWRVECSDASAATRRQRPVLIVGLRRTGRGSDLDLNEEKLLEVLENLRALPIKPSDYAGRPDEPLLPHK